MTTNDFQGFDLQSNNLKDNDLKSSRQQVIEQFAEYIETAAVEMNAETGIESSQMTDLLSLFQELAVLKTEVKTQSRQVKTALDEFKAVFSSLNDNQAYLQLTIDSQRQQHNLQKEQHKKQQDNQFLKPLLLLLVGLYDRLSLSIAAMDEAKPTGFLARFKLPLWQKLQTAKQGQEITLRQLQGIFDSYQIEAINCLELPFEATWMKVIAIDNDPEVENNVVTAELHKGFLWQGQLLRLAEVKVNKQVITGKNP